MNDTQDNNYGLNWRGDLTNKILEFGVVGHQHVDMCNRCEFLLNGVELGILHNDV